MAIRDTRQLMKAHDKAMARINHSLAMGDNPEPCDIESAEICKRLLAIFDPIYHDLFVDDLPF